MESWWCEWSQIVYIFHYGTGTQFMAGKLNGKVLATRLRGRRLKSPDKIWSISSGKKHLIPDSITIGHCHFN